MRETPQSAFAASDPCLGGDVELAGIERRLRDGVRLAEEDPADGLIHALAARGPDLVVLDDADGVREVLRALVPPGAGARPAAPDPGHVGDLAAASASLDQSM